MDQGRLPILVFSGTVTSAEEVRDPAALGVAGYVNEYSAVPHMLPSIAPHLFPDNFNRRGSPRVVLGIPIACRVGKTISAALTLNLTPQFTCVDNRGAVVDVAFAPDSGIARAFWRRWRGQFK
jgi:hypothetical protein